MPIACYDKDGPICKYCVPGRFTSNDPKTWCYGMPRYACIHPIEFDDPIDLDQEATCPESYRIKGRKIMKLIILKNNWKKFKWRFIYSRKKRDKLLALLYSDPIKKVKDYYKNR